MAAKALLVMALLLLVAVTAELAVAETETSQCAQNLVTCAEYLNSTKPPETCCGPLKDAVANDLKCLCSLLNNPSVFKAFKINVTQALELPKHCGITAGTSICNSTTNSTGSAPPSGSGSSVETPAKDNNGGASGIAWMGMSGVMSLLIFWCSIIA